MAIAIFERVPKFLVRQLTPDAAWEAGIANRFGFSARQHSDHKTHDLSGSGRFEQFKDAWAICEADKLVIRVLVGLARARAPSFVPDGRVER